MKNTPEKIRFASIDMGTNTFQMLIAEKQANSNAINRLYKERVFVRLGKDGMEEQTITEAGFKRAFDCLNKYKQKAIEYGVAPENVLAFGTAALREAANQHIFIDEIKKNFNINAKLITGLEEAQLITLAVNNILPPQTKPALIVDIGGGSVETIITQNGQVLFNESVKAGAQLMLNEFDPKNGFKAQDFIKIDNWITQRLKNTMDAVEKHKPEQLIGTAGGFTTLVDIYEQNFGSEPKSNYHFKELPKTALIEIFNWFWCKNNTERMAIKGMIEQRVEMMPLSTRMVYLLISNPHVKKILTCTYGLKEGILINLFN